jgi:cell division protein FtsN
MKIDYAKRYYKHKNKTQRRKKWFTALLVLVVLGAVITGAFFMKTELEKQPKKIAKEQQAVRFSFYNELPAMRVEVKQPVAASVSTPAQEAASSQQGYVLQFGLFKDFNSASQLRLSLLLTGIETEVEKVDDKQRRMYRVQQGPYSTLAQAKSYQQKWLKRGIDSVIKRGGSLEAI